MAKNKAKIGKSQKDTLCRLCKKTDECIDHVVIGSNLHRKNIKEGLVKWYIGNLLESVILKLEISGMNMNQKVF